MHTTDVSQVLSEGRQPGQLVGVKIDVRIFNLNSVIPLR